VTDKLNDSQRARVDAALAGDAPLRDLDEVECAAFHREIALRIQLAIKLTTIGDDLLAQGKSAVYMDDQGRLVEHHPDGSIVFLDEQ